MAERRQEFWGNIEPYSPQFASAALERFNGSQDVLRESKRHSRIQRSWMLYYSRSKQGLCDDTELQTAGDNGEVVIIKPARYRRLIQDQLNLIMQTPPDYQPEAINTDPESQAQCALAMGILAQYTRVAHLEDLGIERSEIALVMGESFLHVRWDPDGGKQHAVEDVPVTDEQGAPVLDAKTQQPQVKQKPIYEGDFTFSVRTPYDVAYDPTSSDRRNPRWWIVREAVSRWDILEQFGGDSDAKRVAILGAEDYSKFSKDWDYEKTTYEFDDSIGVYYVYIEKSRACPDGRRALVLDDNTVLLDGPLDEERAGVFRLAPSEVIFKPEGHTNNFDGMPIAQAHSAQMSMILSNHSNYAMTRLLIAKQSHVKPYMLAAGLQAIEYDHHDPSSGAVPPPTVAQLLGTPGEVFTFDDVLKSELDMVMGGSPVTRGDPDATKGDSGSKAAMLYAAAQSVGSGYVRAKLRSDEDVGSFIISSMRRHATVERITSIVGKNNTYTSRRYKGESLKQISRVNVRQSNPARDTFAGRMSLAELLMQCKTPQEREQVQSLIYTGRIEPMTEDLEAERLLIDRENDALRDPKDGEPQPTVRPGDNHIEHIKKHVACANDPALRADKAAMARHDAHIAGHIAALTPGDPGFAGLPILAATGQHPFPPVQDPTQLPPGAQHQDGQQPPMAAHVAPAQKQAVQATKQVASPTGASMPSMPKDPSTGARVEVPGGAAPSGPVMGGMT